MVTAPRRPFLTRPRQFSRRPGKLDFFLTQMEPTKIIEVEIRGIFSTCMATKCDVTQDHRKHCPDCQKTARAWLKILGSMSQASNKTALFLFWGCLSPFSGHLDFGLQQQQPYEGTVDQQRQWPLSSNLGDGDAKMVYGEVNFARDTDGWLLPCNCSLRQLVAALSHVSEKLWLRPAPYGQPVMAAAMAKLALDELPANDRCPYCERVVGAPKTTPCPYC